MGVIIDHVDGEMHDPPAAVQPPAQQSSQGPGGGGGSPESEMDELERRMALINRRRHRLQAD